MAISSKGSLVSLSPQGLDGLVTVTAEPEVRPGRKIRVVHAYRTYFPDTQGGLEEVIRQICGNMANHQVESRIMALSDNPGKKILRRQEGRVYRPKQNVEIASCGISISAFCYFRKLVDWADVVHYHFPWPFADILHFGCGVQKPTVLTYHSDIVRQRFLGTLYAPLMNSFLSSVDKIVCTSPNYFATSDVLSRYSSKVEVVPIGIEQYATDEPCSEELAEVKQEFGEDFFLFVGVLRYYKGLHILLDAIKDTPYRVVIAGSGPTENELIKQVQILGLNNVKFAGHVSNTTKNALFKLCRGVVFPSYLRSEAFGVTLLEGAMAGKPLISTEVGSGTSHVNVHGETGIIVPPGSPKALRTAMDELWTQVSKAKVMGAKARRRYEDLFTGKLMSARYANIYGRLLEKSDGIDEV